MAQIDTYNEELQSGKYQKHTVLLGKYEPDLPPKERSSYNVSYYENGHLKINSAYL